MKYAVLEDLHGNLLLLQGSITTVQTDESDGIVSKSRRPFRRGFLGSTFNEVTLG